MTLFDLAASKTPRASTTVLRSLGPIVGVMGPGMADAETLDLAHALGHQIARHGWILLTGGRATGVMAAACAGAAAAGGLSIGVLPGENWSQVDPNVTIPILTGMGSARNQINILTSRVVIACGLGPGTVSEIALALKAQRPVVLLAPDPLTAQFCQQIATGELAIAITVDEACQQVQSYLASIE